MEQSLPRRAVNTLIDVTPLHLDLAADAIPLHDPQGLLASGLERLRQLVQEAGLVRQRTAHGWVWWWHQQAGLVVDLGWVSTMNSHQDNNYWRAFSNRSLIH